MTIYAIQTECHCEQYEQYTSHSNCYPGGALKVLRLYVVEARWSNYKFEVLVFSTDVICCHVHDW